MTIHDIIKGIPLERLAFICEAEKSRRLVAFPTTASAKRAAEEAYAEAFCDLAESSANEWLEQQEQDGNARIEATEDIENPRLTELCEAERHGRCVVLPCKIGDFIYDIDFKRPTMNAVIGFRNGAMMGEDYEDEDIWKDGK